MMMNNDHRRGVLSHLSSLSISTFGSVDQATERNNENFLGIAETLDSCGGKAILCEARTMSNQFKLRYAPSRLLIMRILTLAET
jgi:hypothetical protein